MNVGSIAATAYAFEPRWMAKRTNGAKIFGLMNRERHIDARTIMANSCGFPIRALCIEFIYWNCWGDYGMECANARSLSLSLSLVWHRTVPKVNGQIISGKRVYRIGRNGICVSHRGRHHSHRRHQHPVSSIIARRILKIHQFIGLDWCLLWLAETICFRPKIESDRRVKERHALAIYIYIYI